MVLREVVSRTVAVRPMDMLSSASFIETVASRTHA